MTTSTKQTPVPKPPVETKPIESREELLKLIASRETNFTVTVK